MYFDEDDCEDSAAIVFSTTKDGEFTCEIVSDSYVGSSKMTDVATVCVTVFEDWLQQNGVFKISNKTTKLDLETIEPEGNA
jgi:hypothetical protein